MASSSAGSSIGTDDRPKNTDTLVKNSSDRSYDSDNNSNEDRNIDKSLIKYDGVKHDNTFLKCRHTDAVQRSSFEDHHLKKECYKYYKQSKQIQTDNNEQNIPGNTASSNSITDHSIPFVQSSSPEDCSLKKEYDALKNEFNQLKRKHNEVLKERDDAFQKKDQLQNQCQSAIRQWDLIIRERNDLIDVIKKVQIQHQEAVKEMKSAVAFGVKSNKELKNLNKIHDATVKEYRLIMSERDSVHNDLEKQVEDLSRVIKQNKALTKEIEFHKGEKITLQLYVESLKQEISSVLRSRDKVLTVCQQRFGNIFDNDEIQIFLKNNSDNNFSREIKNPSDVRLASLDSFSVCKNERINNLDQAGHQEIEQQSKLDELFNDLKVSKKRRDWAFNERDKIVLERESIRTLADSLRNQREDALSKLACVTKDCDDLMKKNKKLSEELTELKNKMEAGLSFQLQAAGHRSQDSSDMDTDLQDWETEILDIDLGAITSNDDLGINLVGGRDEPLYSNDNSIYIASLKKGSIGSKKLRVNDCILSINNIDCTSISKSFLLGTIKTLNHVTFTVKRKLPDTLSRNLFATQLQGNVYDRRTLLENVASTNQAPAANNNNLDSGDNETVGNIQNPSQAKLPLRASGDISISTTKPTQSVKDCGCRPNSHAYKRYVNCTTQTDRTSFLKYEEFCRKSQHVQSTKVIPDVSNTLVRSLASGHNIVSEQHAIKELSYSVYSTPPPYKDSRKSNEIYMNGSTWPKIGSDPVVNHKTSIIPRARKNENRYSLSVLSNDQRKLDTTDTPSMDLFVRSGNNYNKRVNMKLCEMCLVTEETSISAKTYVTFYRDYLPRLVNSWQNHCVCGNSFIYPVLPGRRTSAMYRFKNHLAELKHNRTQSYDGNFNISESHRDTLGLSPSYEADTFHRRMKNFRFRKSPSVPRTSASDAGGVRGNFTFKIDVLKPGKLPANRQKSSADSWIVKMLKKPMLGINKSGSLPGALRYITIEKCNEVLGFQIFCADSGGIFISYVSENSVASKVGLKVGDHLLEVCGINLRNANHLLATNVLQQCGNSVTLLVQYSPDSMT